MTFKTFLRAGGGAAIAAALAVSASPAFAQDGGRHGRWRDARPAEAANDGATTPSLPQARQQWREQRAQAAAPQRQYTAPQAAPVREQAQARSWNRGDNRSATGAERQGRDWNRRDNTDNDWGQARAAQAQAQARVQAEAQARARIDSGQRSQQWQRNRSYTDGQRNQAYTTRSREGYRDWQQDRQRTQNAYRDGYRTDGRYSGQHQRWSHDWRRDNRYNWSGYRNSNRSVFHLGAYYAPYRNYRYSRLSVGFYLDSLFFGSNYWINDPWQYRLPPAYGPYRWIRYYDDALLVDIYSGEVVDVIYDFFW